MLTSVPPVQIENGAMILQNPVPLSCADSCSALWIINNILCCCHVVFTRGLNSTHRLHVHFGRTHSLACHLRNMSRFLAIMHKFEQLNNCMMLNLSTLVTYYLFQR